MLSGRELVALRLSGAVNPEHGAAVADRAELRLIERTRRRLERPSAREVLVLRCIGDVDAKDGAMVADAAERRIIERTRARLDRATRKPAIVVAVIAKPPTSAPRPRERRSSTSTRHTAAVGSSDDPDLPGVVPPVLSIAEGAALIAGRFQLPLWAGRP